MTHAELAKKIYESCYLTGEFKLRSGQTSSEYFDKYRFESKPDLLRAVAKAMVPLLPHGVDYLAALEMGGIPVATALSLETGIPLVFVRKKAKDYGTCLFAEGADISGKKLCIVEDVITTGGQVVLSTQDLRQAGALVENVLCVIYRSDKTQEPKLTEIGLKQHSLFTRKDFPK